MKLLDRFDRKPRRPDSRFTPGGRRQASTFDEAIKALDRKMDALGVPRFKSPPEEGEEE
jgi:hypothetical protein